MAENQILVKMRPATALGADSRANVRPLRIPVPGAGQPLGIGGEPAWFLVELPEPQASPWDSAHARVADQLGVDSSDVLFVEPDLVHDLFVDDGDPSIAAPTFAIGESCGPIGESTDGGKFSVGRAGWHLEDGFTQLATARKNVPFTERRTCVAHFDTGYFAQHITLPKNIRHDLERNFVDGPANSGNAADPDNHRFLLDNSGHGTGTLSILAGKEWAKSGGFPMGAVPDADVVPLRVADSVVLLRTSAFAAALDYAVDIGCDVGTMSMGGVASRAWRDSVDRAYLAGFCLVAAAGNCTAGLPTRHVVYPARFRRVIAACGVMGSHKAYANLKGKTLEGNYGPDKIMAHAISAYTPNIWWARFGCEEAVRENGEGTSSATPQVAAAVALWFEKHKAVLPRTFSRVEAVRHALFSSAKNTTDRKRLGNGIIQAAKALDVKPMLNLPQTPSDDVSFAFLRVLTGLGIGGAPLREEMFNVEVTQRYLSSKKLQDLVPDPDSKAELDPKTLRKVFEVLIEDGNSSLALRRHLAARYSAVMRTPPRRVKASSDVLPEILAACDPAPELPVPTFRRLRVYASDPSLSTRLETVKVNEATIDVRWERDLLRGPVGEYLEVVDQDAKGKTYRGVNLDEPALLAQNGWAPSEANPQFHQQMTYAVAMNTIAHFERVLGRPVLWRTPLAAGSDDSEFIQRLKVHPHALHQANAFYSPQEVSLKFGYFESGADEPGKQMPGSRAYTCLSHDIIAHETTHAILDGMHRRFIESTNIDMPALHEGFADIVALFQHFTMPEPLRKEIERTRGDLLSESALGSLAVQFGTATGKHGALREAIGRVENGVWKRLVPDPVELHKRQSPHSRGAILVAAVFDAYLAIYKTRVADLLRIYTKGSGVLPEGAIHPDLVNRLAGEAAKTAGHVLTMCIRALDYLPPVDVTFFDYLRALITADFDFVPEDPHHYRVAFIEAFRARGIYPLGVAPGEPDALRTLSVDTVRWDTLENSRVAKAVVSRYVKLIEWLREYADKSVYCRSRKELFDLTHDWRRKLHVELEKAFQRDPALAKDLRLDPRIKTFEVHSLRRATRTTDDGRNVRQLIIALTQSRNVPARMGQPAFQMRGGSTLIVDLAATTVTYRIYKNINSPERLNRTAAFTKAVADDPVRKLLLGAHDEPFAALHSLFDLEK